MEKKLINDLLGAITDVVAADEPYAAKRDAILHECGDDDKTMLYEFLAWFEVEEPK